MTKQLHLKLSIKINIFILYFTLKLKNPKCGPDTLNNCFVFDDPHIGLKYIAIESPFLGGF